MQSCTQPPPTLEEDAFDEVEDDAPCVGQCSSDLRGEIKARGARLSRNASKLLRYLRLAIKHTYDKMQDDPMVLLKVVAGGAAGSAGPVVL